jgi:hypothetical protein
MVPGYAAETGLAAGIGYFEVALGVESELLWTDHAVLSSIPVNNT